jgi:hypothetical protein
VIGAADVTNKAVFWIFKSIYTGQPRPDMMLLYRWDIQRWTTAPTVAQWICRIPVVTADGGEPPTIAPLSQGLLQLAAVHTLGHLGFFNGPFLAAQVGTKVVQINEGMRTFVNFTRPLVDSFPPQTDILTESGSPLLTESGSFLLTEPDAATITVAMSARNTYQQPETFGPEIGIDVSGNCPQRSDGRYHRGRISVPGGIWAKLAGLDVEGVRSGLR